MSAPELVTLTCTQSGELRPEAPRPEPSRKAPVALILPSPRTEEPAPAPPPSPRSEEQAPRAKKKIQVDVHDEPPAPRGQ